MKILKINQIQIYNMKLLKYLNNFEILKIIIIKIKKLRINE